jgi:hypothetical protein
LHSIQASFGSCIVAALLAWSAGTARSQPSPEVRARNEGQQGAQLARPASASPSQAAAAVADSAVLASFKGGRITVADMQAAVANKDPSTRARIAAPGGREAFLEQLVRYDLLVLEAERRGYGYDADVIEAGKLAAITHMLERDLAVEPSAISADDVKRHFEANVARYKRPAMRRASHIELASEDDARALIAELKGATRERFAKVAGERSRDERTRRQGGELGYFDREGRLGGVGEPGAVPRELVEATFALGGSAPALRGGASSNSGTSPALRGGEVMPRAGAISSRPIKGATGFSVLMLTGEMPALAQKLADVEDALRAELAEKRSTEAQEALVAELREQWKPEVHPERIDAITLPPGKPLDQPQGFPAAPPDPRAASRFVEPDGF